MFRKLIASLLLVPLFAFGAAPFAPAYQGSKTISCTTSSAATALPTTLAGALPMQIVVKNKGSASSDTIMIETGDSTIASAVATGYPVLAGSIEIITVAGSATHIACISATGTQTVFVSIGRGE